MRTLSLLPVLALAACVSAPPPQIRPVSVASLSSMQIDMVQRGVRQVLKDPESARFGQIVGGRNDLGVMMVCGQVNAKNSFGGYTGTQPFSGEFNQAGAFTVAGIGGDEIVTLSIRQVCARLGLHV